MSNNIDLGAYDALVLDCWDTLLHRDVVEPMDRFYRPGDPAARYKRERAEFDIRIAQFGRTGSAEVTLSKFMKMDREYRAERAGCFLSPSNVALADAFRAAGKRVLIVSDTYMSQMELIDVLPRDPRLDGAQIHTSCSDGKPKGEGLIGDILAAEGIDPKRTLVIGDNPSADGRGAAMCGATYGPYVGYTPTMQKRLTSTNELCKRHLHRPMRAPHKRQLIERQFDDPFLELGYSLLGPIVSAILHRIDRSQVTTFVSRDTWLLHELYEGPKQYLCINREIALRTTARDDAEKREAVARIVHIPHAVQSVMFGDNNEIDRERMLKHIASLRPLDHVLDLGCRGVTFELLQRLGVRSDVELVLALPDSNYPSVARFEPYTAWHVILNRVSVLETLLKQPVGSLTGYGEDGRPIFKARTLGPQAAIVDEIQRGARLFYEQAGPSDQDLEAHVLQLFMGEEPPLEPLLNELGPLCNGATLRVDRSRP
jgi:predicted HAD superfamily hydrolase